MINVGAKKVDDITKQLVGIIQTKEKGGDVLISLQIYKKLKAYFTSNDTLTFKIKYQDYLNDIKNACEKLNINYQGSYEYR